MVNAERLALSNPWWTKGQIFVNWDPDLLKDAYESFIVKRLTPGLERNKIYIIKGPRRSGKTTWLKRIVESNLKSGAVDKRAILYFSFDESVSQKEFSNLVRQFLETPLAPDLKFLLLDEIQGVIGWEEVLKNLFDSGLLKNVVTVVTGSIAHLLKTDTLPGRGTEGNIYLIKTLNFSDVVKTLLQNDKSHPIRGYTKTAAWINQPLLDTEVDELRNKIEENAIDLSEDIKDIYKKINNLFPFLPLINKLFLIYLHTGGYPLSINDYFKNEGNKKFGEIEDSVYNEIYLYLKNDAAMISGKALGDPSYAAKVIEANLKYLGIKTSFSKASRQIGMNKTTFMNYSNRLENSYAFINLNGLKRGIEPTETKKTFFSDIFMHYSAKAASTGKSGQVITDEILNSSEVGVIVEEAVAAHLSKIREIEPMVMYNTYLGFYYENEEIDFVYKSTNGKILGVEVKYQNEVSTQDVKKSKGIHQYIIVTKNTFDLIDDVLFIPAPLFLLLLKKSSHDL